MEPHGTGASPKKRNHRGRSYSANTVDCLYVQHVTRDHDQKEQKDSVLGRGSELPENWSPVDSCGRACDRYSQVFTERLITSRKENQEEFPRPCLSWVLQ